MVLENYPERKEAIMNCAREGTPDDYYQLKLSTLGTIHIVKDMVSKPKQKDPCLLKEYRALNHKPALELKALAIVLAHKNNLRSYNARYRRKISIGVVGKRFVTTVRSRKVAEFTENSGNLSVS